MFGYDFMIDDQYNAWFIEINSSPSMDYSTVILNVQFLGYNHKASEIGFG